MILSKLEPIRQECLGIGVRALRFTQDDAHLAFTPELNPAGFVDISKLKIDLLDCPEGSRRTILKIQGDFWPLLPSLTPIRQMLIPLMRDFTAEAVAKTHELDLYADTSTCFTLYLEDMYLACRVERTPFEYRMEEEGATVTEVLLEAPLSVALWSVPDNRYELLQAMRREAVPDPAAAGNGAAVSTPFAMIKREGDYEAAIQAGALSRDTLAEVYACWDRSGDDRQGYRQLTVPQQWLVHAIALHARDLHAKDVSRLLSAGIYSLGANPHVTLTAKQIYSLFITGLNQPPARLTPDRLPLNLYHLTPKADRSNTKLMLVHECGEVTEWLVGHVKRLASNIEQTAQQATARQRQKMGEQFRRQVGRIGQQLQGWENCPIRFQVPHVLKTFEDLMSGLDEQMLRLNMNAKVPTVERPRGDEAMPTPMDIL